MPAPVSTPSLPRRYARRSSEGMTSVGLIGLVAAVLSSIVVGTAAIQATANAPTRSPLTDEVVANQAEAFGNLPLSFVPNMGQHDAEVLFSAQASGVGVALTPSEAILAITPDTERGQGDSPGYALGLRFLGAQPEPRVAPLRPAPGNVNYLIGDPSDWRTGLTPYEGVVYRDPWPGIDLRFHGGEGRLKYEFVVHPGGRIEDIRLTYRGAQKLSLDRDGNLDVHTPLGTLVDERPFTYQQVGDRRVPVESRFALGRGGASYGFEVGAYDRERPLIIDPALVYSSFLGGSGSDQGFAIAVDDAGNAYVSGHTDSADFPTTPGAFDTSFNGGPSDVVVTKLDAKGSALVYSTYLGGGLSDEGKGIAVDGAGNAYVTGVTASPNFPTTPGAHDTMFTGIGADAFVTKLDATGSALVYSTYLGGSTIDFGFDIAVDAGGEAYVTGDTGSADFPTTGGAFDAVPNGSADAFVTKLNAAGSALVYSTYLGGSGSDLAFDIALDGAENAYVTGSTESMNFPTTGGAFDTTFGGVTDVFVTKLNATGSALAYSTYLGGIGIDGRVTGNNQGIAVDGAGSAYVTGFTSSADFPTTPGAFDTSLGGFGDAFVTKLNAAGSSLVYSTYLGGTDFDEGDGIAVDGAESAYVTGHTSSEDFPTTPGAFDKSFNGNDDAFVTRLNATGSALVDSTFLGGSDLDLGGGIAVDGSGDAYVTGYTRSADFPTTHKAFDQSFNGGATDAFVTRLKSRHGGRAKK